MGRFDGGKLLIEMHWPGGHNYFMSELLPSTALTQQFQTRFKQYLLFLSLL